MVPFAGYEMPVQYADLGVGDSHRWTREKASLFDVGHMVQHRLNGPGAASLLEQVTPAAVNLLETHNSTLSCLLHPVTGGIVDDCIITRLGPEAFYLVTNAACRDKDTAYLKEHIDAWNAGEVGTHLTTGTSISSPESTKVDWEILNGWGLVALQGPASANILSSLLPDTDGSNDLSTLYFGQSRFLTLNHSPSSASTPFSNPVLVSRAGYTGEDGFELSISPEDTVALTQALLEAGGKDQLRLAGLGARDSLRLEAGMCLYGHDLDDSTTPVEASLAWLVPRSRRSLPEAGSAAGPGSGEGAGTFHGAETIIPQLMKISDGGTGVSRRRVGLLIEDGAPAREGAIIIAPGAPETEQAGRITSGVPSPSLGKNIAMGYVSKKPGWKVGTQVEVLVRGKRRKAEIVKMPFVQSRFWKGQSVSGGTAPM
ncbi:MAG: hypothetical protein M4579_006369 [Chaenotheca gracillima]|nr:MAG: hypothetical protein M4579_006369 [Chaenotheca gracillima]